MNRTVVIGASPNPGKYSYIATERLKECGEEVYPIGIRDGHISGDKIITDRPLLENIETVTLYVGPRNQSSWFNYILRLAPKRVIFNPGTENEELYRILEENGINYEIACTLVLLSTGSYSTA